MEKHKQEEKMRYQTAVKQHVEMDHYWIVMQRIIALNRNILHIFVYNINTWVAEDRQSTEKLAVSSTDRCMCGCPVHVLCSPFLSMEWGSDCFLPISAKERTIGMRLASFLWFWWWCCLRRASRIFLLASSPTGPDASYWSRTMSREENTHKRHCV